MTLELYFSGPAGDGNGGLGDGDGRGGVLTGLGCNAPWLINSRQTSSSCYQFQNGGRGLYWCCPPPPTTTQAPKKDMICPQGFWWSQRNNGKNCYALTGYCCC